MAKGGPARAKLHFLGDSVRIRLEPMGNKVNWLGTFRKGGGGKHEIEVL